MNLDSAQTSWPRRPGFVPATIFLGLLALCIAHGLRANEGGSASRPSAAHLTDAESTSYRKASAGLVRVEIPTPKWVRDYVLEPLRPWPRLEPAVRRQLDPAMGPSSAIVVAPNSPQPQTNMSAPSADGSTEAPSGGMPPSVRGLVLDRQGDILIPFYIEFQTAKVTPIRIDLGNGQTVTAQFIGGDRATNLTVVRVEQLHLEPCLLAQQAPTEGVMTMVISSIDGAARVGVFPPALSDNGFLFSDKAEVLGLVRYGDYFSASTCRHLADQLIQHGEIRRSSLGVKVTETPLDPALAAASTGRAWAVARGLRVSQSIPGSPAGLAGIGSGDILLSLGQTPLTDIPMLAAELAERLGPTEMKFLRNGVVHSVMVELRSRTAADDAQTLQSPMGSPPSR